MSVAKVEKKAQNGTLAKVTKVTSDFPFVESGQPTKAQKSLATTFDERSPLSLEREGGGGIKHAPPPPSLVRYPTQNTTADVRLALAAHVGAVSRFCGLMGIMPESPTAEACLDAFGDWMSKRQSEQPITTPEWTF